jgi:hypothetical protein
MNKQKRNAVLAFFGLLVLSIYILACTSFSPDDTKVLYPSFDAASGAIGMAVYDRRSRGSEMLFVPVAYQGTETNILVAPTILRAQWLANGRDIVISYVAPGDGNKDAMTVAVVPWAARKPVRTFRVPDLKDVAETFVVPLCIAGDRVFLRAESKGLVRLDLGTGALGFHEFDDAKRELSFYPAPDGAAVFYFEPEGSSNERSVFGRLNPGNFSRTPLMVISNRPNAQITIAYDTTGKILALLGSDKDEAELQVWRDGQPPFSRTVDTHGHKRIFGNSVLAATGKAVRATFQQANGTNSMSYGLMEIPFSDGPTREVVLIKQVPVDDEIFAYYFQAAVSHDGKTAAVASTYLACTDKGFNPADCALFLVDMSAPNWKVTKVPIPVPAKPPMGLK